MLSAALVKEDVRECGEVEDDNNVSTMTVGVTGSDAGKIQALRGNGRALVPRNPLMHYAGVESLAESGDQKLNTESVYTPPLRAIWSMRNQYTYQLA